MAGMTGDQGDRRYMPHLRLMDPDFEGRHLFFGKTIGGTTWWCFRLTEETFSRHRIDTNRCEQVREAGEREVARIEQDPRVGSHKLIPCYVNGELYAHFAP
jgi:hypothetical protein